MVNKKKILIGSADPEFAFGIKFQLEGMGAFSPVLVTGARELIEVEQMFYFSVILVDALLDDYPGFEVCRKLREAGRDTPIILFSRTPELEFARIRNSWQADRCLAKSVPVPDLFDRIREVMEAKAKSSTRETQTGRKADSQKEEKFDGLEEMVKGDLLAEMSSETPAEPQVEERPAAPEPEIVEAPIAEEPVPDVLEPLLDLSGKPGAGPETLPGVVPAELEPLEEEIASKLDELNETEKPKVDSPPAFREETEEIADVAGGTGREETDREPEAAGEAPVAPEPEPTEEIGTAAEIRIIKEEKAQESGTSEIGESEARLVPWNSAMKILAVLAGLGLGLGYFLAR